MDPIYVNYHPTFLYADKYRFSELWVYQEERVPYALLRYICAGRAQFRVNDVSYEVAPGDVFYIPQDSKLYCQAHEEFEFISIRFLGSIQVPGTDMLKDLWGITQLYHDQERPEMGMWFEKLYHSSISRMTYRQLEIRGYLNLICAELARQSSESQDDEDVAKRERVMMESMDDMKYIRRRAMKSQQKTDPRLRVLVDYITLHPERILTREEMCSMCGVSESTLRRLFKAEMGKTIAEFIRDTKMVYAANLLVTTSDLVSDIAYRLGFESPSYFTKSFRENYGVSPQEYRKMSCEM